MLEEIVQEEEVTEDEVDETESDETTEEQEEEQSGVIDWEARAKKAEALIIKNKQKPKQKSTNTPQESGVKVPEWGQKLLESENKRSFQAEYSLTPDTVDAVFRANGGVIPTPEQMEEDELIKTVVRSFQAKARVAGNTPRGGSLPTYKGKTYAEVVTDKDMTPADKQAAFDAARKKHGIK